MLSAALIAFAVPCAATQVDVRGPGLPKYAVDCSDTQTCVRVLAPEDLALVEHLDAEGLLVPLYTSGSGLGPGRELYVDRRQSALVVVDCDANIARLHGLLACLWEFHVPRAESAYELNERGVATVTAVLDALVASPDGCAPRAEWSLDGNVLAVSGPASTIMALTDDLAGR